MRTAGAFLVVALLALGGGCASSSKEVSSEVPEDIRSDTEYYTALKKWQIEEQVISSFQKRLEVNAVLLTNEFRKAYLSRFVRMRGETQGQLDESIGNRIGVLVSLFSPERDYEGLDDRRLWTLTMKYGKTELRNPEVKSLTEKVVLKPFFPFITQWTREFLVVFDPQSADTALPNEVGFLMRSALAGVEMVWK